MLRHIAYCAVVAANAMWFFSFLIFSYIVSMEFFASDSLQNMKQASIW